MADIEAVAIDLTTREKTVISALHYNLFAYVSYLPGGVSVIQAAHSSIFKTDLITGDYELIAEGSQPSVSRDKSRIVFVRETKHKSDEAERGVLFFGDLYTADINGKNIARITNNGVPNFVPRFSPDGTSVYFMSLRDGEVAIYQINLRTRTEIKTHSVGPPFTWDKWGYFNEWPYIFDLSPDGKWIAFLSGTEQSLSFLDIDTGKMISLGEGREPAFSSDGKTIAFIRGHNLTLASVDGILKQAADEEQTTAMLEKVGATAREAVSDWDVVATFAAVVAIGLYAVALFKSRSPQQSVVEKGVTKEHSKEVVANMAGGEDRGGEEKKGAPKTATASFPQGTSAEDINVDFAVVERTSKSRLKTWKDSKEQGRKRGGIEERMKTRELALKALDQELEGTKKIKEIWKERGEIEKLPPKEQELYEATIDQKIAEAKAGQIEAQARQAEGQQRIRDAQKESEPPPKEEDPLKAHEEKVRIETEKKKINLKYGQEVRQAEADIKAENRTDREQMEKDIREKLYPLNFQTYGGWIETLKEKLGKHAEDVLERYQSELQDLDKEEGK